MKKILITGLIIVLIAGFVYYFFIRTPYSIAHTLSHLNLPGNMVVKQYKDEWNYNLNGDGETLIVFTFQEGKKKELISACEMHNYKLLPIKEQLPDNFIYTIFSKANELGYYDLEIDKKNGHSYKLIILDLSNNELIAYNVIY